MFSKHISTLFWAAAMLASIQACDTPDAPDILKKSGEIVTDSIAFAHVSHLNVNSSFDISLVKDTTTYALVTYGKNLIGNIDFKYSPDDRLLDMYDNSSSRISRNNQSIPKVEFHYSNLGNIYTYATVFISSSDYVDVPRYVFVERLGGLDILSNAPNLCVEVWTGGGIYKVRGEADEFYTEPHYSAVIDASQLSVRKAVVNTLSCGDVTVSPTDTLETSISWTGDVLYEGSPVVIEKEHTGKGKTIQIAK